MVSLRVQFGGTGAGRVLLDKDRHTRDFHWVLWQLKVDLVPQGGLLCHHCPSSRRFCSGTCCHHTGGSSLISLVPEREVNQNRRLFHPLPGWHDQGQTEVVRLSHCGGGAGHRVVSTFLTTWVLLHFGLHRQGICLCHWIRPSLFL